MKGKLRKLLIANRGEIAVRVIRAAKELGIETVAVFSPADAGQLHTRLADEKIALGGSLPKDSYLNTEQIVLAALQSGADAIHPGYGFLAENAAFAAAVQQAKLKYVGPTPVVIELMGDKHRAREAAVAAGVPVLPGTATGLPLTKLREFGRSCGYPLMVKAAAGGSGRGMRVIAAEEELEAKIGEAQREAAAAFGSDAVFLEKFLPAPRHIEVQIMADERGSVLHVGERECSVQRRHQKLVEEAPAPQLHAALRDRIRHAAVALAKSVDYCGAGTIEFLVDGGREAGDQFYFLEMNTRIQVEHPVTEEVFAVDLVAEQLRVADGSSLSFAQGDVVPRGHAIEFRIYAEDPAADFRPALGELLYLSRNGGPGIREDGWAEAGNRISPYYDSLLYKLIVSGNNRAHALSRARAALAACVVEGVPTTLDFHRWLVAQPDFASGLVDVKWLERVYRGELKRAAAVGPLHAPKNAFQ